DLWTEHVQMGEPRGLAASDVDRVADRTPQEILSHGEGHRDLPPYFRLGADLRAAPVPAVEVRLVIPFLHGAQDYNVWYSMHPLDRHAANSRFHSSARSPAAAHRSRCAERVGTLRRAAFRVAGAGENCATVALR